MPPPATPTSKRSHDVAAASTHNAVITSDDAPAAKRQRREQDAVPAAVATTPPLISSNVNDAVSPGPTQAVAAATSSSAPHPLPSSLDPLAVLRSEQDQDTEATKVICAALEELRGENEEKVKTILAAIGVTEAHRKRAQEVALANALTENRRQVETTRTCLTQMAALLSSAHPDNVEDMKHLAASTGENVDGSVLIRKIAPYVARAHVALRENQAAEAKRAEEAKAPPVETCAALLDRKVLAHSYASNYANDRTEPFLSAHRPVVSAASNGAKTTMGMFGMQHAPEQPVFEENRATAGAQFSSMPIDPEAQARAAEAMYRGGPTSVPSAVGGGRHPGVSENVLGGQSGLLVSTASAQHPPGMSIVAPTSAGVCDLRRHYKNNPSAFAEMFQ
jgi:hypothetical protein